MLFFFFHWLDEFLSCKPLLSYTDAKYLVLILELNSYFHNENCVPSTLVQLYGTCE